MIGKGEVVVINPRGIGKIMSEKEAEKRMENGEIKKNGDDYLFVKNK